MRGNERRMIELPDLFYMELPNEGPSTCYALIVQMNNGKENQYHKKQIATCTRHRDVFVCPVGGLFMHLFFLLESQGFPEIDQPGKWLTYKLFRGPGGPTESIKYETTREWIADALKALKIHSSKKTHIERGCSIRSLDALPDSELRRQGRWAGDAMSNYYMTGIAVGAVRVLSGFSHQGGSYYIKRAAITPPGIHIYF